MVHCSPFKASLALWRPRKRQIDDFYSYQSILQSQSKRPIQAHLRAYACKAFAMTTSAQKKAHRLRRLDPKAWIGYLIGYNSSNIYRIWIPSENRVINTRDVIFNENVFFSGNKETLKDDLLHTSIEELAELVKRTALPDSAEDVPEV